MWMTIMYISLDGEPVLSHVLWHKSQDILVEIIIRATLALPVDLALTALGRRGLSGMGIHPDSKAEIPFTAHK
jgi:hypothetical protein